MTDRISMLTRSIPVPNIAAPHVAMVVLENMIIPYGISNTNTMDDGPKFVSKFFAALC